MSLSHPASPGGSVPRCRLGAGLAPALALLLLAGCAGMEPIFPGTPPAPPTADVTATYHLAIASSILVTDERLHEGVLRATRGALASRGWKRMDAADPADFVVTLDYRVGPPRETMALRSESVYKIVPGEVSEQSVAVGVHPGGNTRYELRIVREPDERVYVGEQTVRKKVTVHEKRLVLTARSSAVNPSGGADPETWHVELTAEGPGRDIRPLVPILAGPAARYLAGEFIGPVTIRIDEDEGAIESVSSQVDLSAEPPAVSPLP